MKTAIQTVWLVLITCVPEAVKMAKKFGLGVVITTRALKFKLFFFLLILCCQVLPYLSLHFTLLGKWSSWLVLSVCRICHWIFCARIVLQEGPYIQILLLRLHCVKSLLTHWISQIHFLWKFILVLQYTLHTGSQDIPGACVHVW